MKTFWNAAWTILKREVRSQFASPMAYIFIIVFLTFTTGLFLFFRAFFSFPTADMTEFFGFMVPVLCIFAPAATMRIWAEDRKENTIEMLLTFPMSAPALVLGKFLAAMVFYLAALASTFMIPVMIAWLGEPDWGVIVSGYLGAVLMGALFLSLGMFVSGFCRDQVTAFVVSFLACAAAALFGWEAFGARVEGSLGGPIGGFLRSFLGMTSHFVPFTRGVVKLGDVLYFLAWTAIFLFLNGVYLEGRSRPRVYARFGLTVLLALVVGLLFNLTIGRSSILRFDLTEDKIHTVSPATAEILRELKIPVQVKLYISREEKMPTYYRNLERDVVDRLRDMSDAGGGMLQWKVHHMETANVLREPEEEEEGEEGTEKDRRKSLEERLLDKGVRPFTVRAFGEGQTTTQLVYSSLGVAYKEKEEEIIPQVVPDNLPELEYRLMSVVFKLTREKEPVVALVAPTVDVQIPPHLMKLYAQMGQLPPKREDPFEFLQRVLEHEKYDVRRIKLTKDEPLPDEYDALVVLNPRELDERQKWEIARAIAEGKPTLLAVQKLRWNYSRTRDGVSITKTDEKPGANDFLEDYGLEVADDILMDSNHEALTMTNPANPLERLFGGGLMLKLPMHIAVNPSSMNQAVSITSRIGRIFYLWGNRLRLDEGKLEEKKLEVTVLFSTSDEAWTRPGDEELTPRSIEMPEGTEQYPLAVLVRSAPDGHFPDVYAGKDRPSWPDKPPGPGMPPPPPDDSEDEEEPAEPLKPAPGKLVLVGCAEMFSSNFLRGGNLDFFMNCIDVLCLGEELIGIRSKKPIDRVIDRPSTAGAAFWKFMDMLFVPALVVAAGVARALVVRRSRERYAAALARKV
jgi:ABC-type uncharacterized transport system involved in gliding motility auxiliary subunit